MDFFSIILIILGLCLFETVSSIDNAVVNAEVLTTMSAKARRWFLTWGIFFAVFVLRGLLPWIIIWLANPSVGPLGALTAAFSNDPHIMEAVEKSSPLLLLGGGIFLILLFLHWLFLEPKNFGLAGEKFFSRQGAWFFSVAAVFLAAVIWFTLKVDPMLAFAATLGSTAFFITHGFKQHAEQAEKELKGGHSRMSDISKLLYLEVLDATFSIDGVVGAFAFTLSVPLIILGNGLGAMVVRQLTIKGAEKIKKYAFLKNGAMYSILCLGAVMLLDGFGVHVPSYVSPVITFAVVGYFFLKSKN
ncbi:MAG: hypothetical protein UT31_C0029G0007 [Parcubacteria group bacterium GW2011_GWF2_39_13b]|nr:MAG: hypothetical protein UT31_C0029G0007 [Parcubacteria group bacterium GW2011_GWF2_39_13b]